ncbi:MAG: UvrD-helicase domain-containing protein [Mariniblastus sp.]|nr:UvrD-helicase domain-containing protein [Mariniblastus sp.]
MNSEPAKTFSNDVIRASAGTGKTYRLSNRYLQLLASGVPCESILATTFTRKGAGEILDRIIQRLAEAALDDGAAETLSAALQVEFDTSRAQSMLADLMVNLHRLQIGTLDGFFSRIAQSFSLELALPNDWSIVQEQEMDLLRDQAIQQVLREDSVLQLVRLMNKGDAQRRVSELIRLTVRAIYSIYLDSEPGAWNQIPACNSYLTDQELDELVVQLEGLESIDFPHSKQKGQLQKEIQHLVNRDWDALIQSKMFATVVSGESSYYKPLPPELVELYSRLVPHCRAYVVARLIQQNTSTFELLKQYSRRFEELKTAEGQLRFDDITQRLVAYVAAREMRAMAFRMDHQIHHLLLDEFQDTSPSQWSVIKPFALRAAEEGDDRSFFCVGDTKQAIFGWRGGLAEIFDVVTGQLKDVNDTEKLSISYRSSPVVIEMVNSVFGQLGELEFKKPLVQLAVRQWQERFETHKTAKQELSGYVTMEYAPEAEDAENWWEKAAQRNQNVIQRTVDLISGLSARHAADDELTIGVLVRKNETVGQLIFGLQQAGIPASEEGGNPLTDSAAVELVLSAIQLIDHPSDSIARFHVSHSPLAARFGLEPEVTGNQQANAETAVLSANPLRKDLLSKGYGPTIESMACDLVDHCTRRELMRLQQLVQQAFNYDDQVRGERSRIRADRFVAYIRKEFRAHDRSSAKIRVMTVHQSKGLEFDIVVLPFQTSRQGWLNHRPDVVVDRPSPTEPVSIACRWVSENERHYLAEPFPQMFEQEREGEVRESLSVLYVALTRAVRAVHLVISRGAKASDVSDEGILLSTLGAGADKNAPKDKLIYELGDPNWYRQTPGPLTPPAADERLDEFYLSDDAMLTPVGLDQTVRSGRGLTRTSPSSLEGGSRVRLQTIFSAHDQQDALLYGSLIHRCFQQVHWLEDFKVDRQGLLDQVKQVDPSPAACQHAVGDFEQMLKTDSVAHVLSLDRYQQEILPEFLADHPVSTDAIRLEVQNERPFAVYHRGELVQGFIDRLVLIYNGANLIAADLIDFKTDQVTEENMGQRVEYYRPQLNAYRMAVSRFCHLPIERVTARLLFVASDRRVDIELTEEETATWAGDLPDGDDPGWGLLESDLSTPTPSRPDPSGGTEPAAETDPLPPGQMKLWDDD